MGPLLLAGAAAAWPCAGISHAEGVLAESGAAEVLFEPVPGMGEVTVSYAVEYDGDAPDLGWVIPVPATPTQVQDGDPAVFASLREASQVVVDWTFAEDDGGGCTCLGGASKGDGGGSREFQDGVVVVAQGFTGTYDYVAIAASDASELEEWFVQHGWTGLAADDLDHYVAAGSTFVALRVVPETAETPPDGRSLPPIRITYGGDELVFPSVMALHGTLPTQRTTAYVVAPTRATTLSGWTSEDGATLSGGTDDDPVALWDAHLATVGAERAWVRSFAGSFEGDFLTRFDTLAPREVHDADAVFALEDSVDPIESRIALTEDGASTAALLLLPLAGLGAWRRRRS
jgi:MYXO-CTERM domain-containing protein